MIEYYNMKTTDIFIKTLQSFISEEITQSKLAELIGVTRQQLNDFLKGRRNFSEDRKELIAENLGKTYLEMLNKGQKLIDSENDISFNSINEGVEKFKHKNTSFEEEFILKKKTVEISRIFIRAVEYMLSKEPKGAQGKLADKLNMQRTSINDFLRGRRNFSEKKKEQLSKVFGLTYIEMLNIGQGLIDKEKEGSSCINNSSEKPDVRDDVTKFDGDEDENPLEIEDLLHSELIKNFKQKQLVKKCNMLMTELENIDPSELQEVKEFLDYRLARKKKMMR